MKNNDKKIKQLKHNRYIKSVLYGTILSLCIVTSSTAEMVSNSSVKNKTFTKAEFQECNKNINFLVETEKQILIQREKLITLQNKINQLVQDRTNMNKELDLHNQKSVKQYNQLNNNIHRLSQQFNNDGKIFNQDVKQYQSNKKQLITNCHGKQYYK